VKFFFENRIIVGEVTAKSLVSCFLTQGVLLRKAVANNSWSAANATPTCGINFVSFCLHKLPVLDVCICLQYSPMDSTAQHNAGNKLPQSFIKHCQS